MDDAEKKRRLLRFLDERVFRPVLEAAPGPGREGPFLRDAQVRVRRTWVKYPSYATAADVRRQFLTDLTSDFGQTLASLLEWLELPRFEDVKDEFLGLCAAASGMNPPILHLRGAS